MKAAIAAGRAALVIPLLWVGMATAAEPVVLPPAATPGGAQPRLAPALPAPPLAPVTVPRVPDRPLGMDEGPRVHVRRFDLIGAATQPEIFTTAIDALLTQAIVLQGPEGYTVNELHRVAQRVAELYRNRGLILTQIVVPAQEVVGGVVNILVVDGALGALRFEGQQMYSPQVLGRPFRDLLARSIRKDEIETALLRLTDYPGLSAFGVFQPGSRVGTTDLVIRTQHEQRLAFDAALDNQGSQYSGEYRANLRLGINNPLGRADRLNLFGLYAFDTRDSQAKGLYGGFDYQTPLFDAWDSLQLGYSHNLFEVGRVLRGLGIEGRTRVTDISYARTFSKARLGEFSAHAGLARKDAEFEQQGSASAHDLLAVVRFGLQLERIGLRTRGVTQLSLDYSHGLPRFLGSMGSYAQQMGTHASRLGGGGEFDKFTVALQRYQNVTQNQALLLRASGQYSSDLLVSLEQFSIGGPDTVRAYPGAEFLADSGGFMSLEWITNAPGFAARQAPGGYNWGQLLQVSLFVDHARGRLNEVLPGEDRQVSLTGGGLALQLNVPNRFLARLDVATPIGGPRASNGRSPQYFIRLGFSP